MKTLDKTEKHKSLEVNGNSLPATERSSHVPRPPERLKDYVCFGTLHGVKLIAELFHLGNFIIIVFLRKGCYNMLSIARLFIGQVILDRDIFDDCMTL